VSSNIGVASSPAQHKRETGGMSNIVLILAVLLEFIRRASQPASQPASETFECGVLSPAPIVVARLPRNILAATAAMFELECRVSRTQVRPAD